MPRLYCIHALCIEIEATSLEVLLGFTKVKGTSENVTGTWMPHSQSSVLLGTLHRFFLVEYNKVLVFQMKLYSVSDGPPSLACRQALKALGIDYELVDVDFGKGEHMTKEYEKLNPQKEIPVLVDGDLVMGESNAILQYLGDKYDKDGKLYPKDAKARATVNHRLCFNLAMYYRNISEYVMAPIFFDYERTPLGLKKMTIALDVFETYLKRENSEYAAGNTLTIADFPLFTATLCLEAIDFKLNQWPHVQKWYNNFKRKHPELWEVVKKGMEEIQHFEKNPPCLSDMEHPIHPVRKSNA